MKKTQVDLLFASGKKSVQAYIDQTFPGLAIHRIEEGSNWGVTHIKTGYSVLIPGCSYGWYKRRQAVVYAQELCKCANWDKDDPMEGIRGKIKAALTAARDTAQATC